MQFREVWKKLPDVVQSINLKCATETATKNVLFDKQSIHDKQKRSNVNLLLDWHSHVSVKEIQVPTEVENISATFGLITSLRFDFEIGIKNLNAI